MYCTVMYCTLMHLCCDVLHFNALYCNGLHFNALYSNVPCRAHNSCLVAKAKQPSTFLSSVSISIDNPASLTPSSIRPVVSCHSCRCPPHPFQPLPNLILLTPPALTPIQVLKAAAWIVGEYSEIVSLIAHDTGKSLFNRHILHLSLPLQYLQIQQQYLSLSHTHTHTHTADVSDSPGDSGYWIEGPTGEDIRSSWRGQPVHVLVVDALLHPRATNLPPHVQSAYIQSAMKVSKYAL